MMVEFFTHMKPKIENDEQKPPWTKPSKQKSPAKPPFKNLHELRQTPL